MSCVSKKLNSIPLVKMTNIALPPMNREPDWGPAFKRNLVFQEPPERRAPGSLGEALPKFLELGFLWDISGAFGIQRLPWKLSVHFRRWSWAGLEESEMVRFVSHPPSTCLAGAIGKGNEPGDSLKGNHNGVAQNLRARVTQVLVFGSIYRGAIVLLGVMSHFSFPASLAPARCPAELQGAHSHR